MTFGEQEESLLPREKTLEYLKRHPLVTTLLLGAGVFNRSLTFTRGRLSGRTCKFHIRRRC